MKPYLTVTLLISHPLINKLNFVQKILILCDVLLSLLFLKKYPKIQ